MRLADLRSALTGVVVVVLAASLAGCSSSNPDERGAKEIGQADTAGGNIQLLKDPSPVADFSIVDLDGKAITTKALRGKVVLVNFWATWCPPCRAEIPDLIALQARYKDQLVVIGISEDEAPVDTVRAFAAEHKMNYFIAMTTPDISKVFRGVSALPTTFVIDREGRIVQRHIGQLNAENTELEARYLSGLDPKITVAYVESDAKALLAKAAQATEIPGIDLTKMTPEKRTAAIKAMNAEQCTCGCELTLAECRINDPSCSISLPLAQKLADKIAQSN